MRRIFFHHATQTGNLDVDRTFHRRIFTTTGQVHQLVAGQRLTRMANQCFQHCKLTAGERHRLIFTEHFTRTEVQFELTKRNDRFFLRRRARQFIRLTAQDCANTCQQFTRVKRFRDVIVSADFQSNDTVHFFALRRNHNDRHRVALAAQATANRQAIFSRQH